jgi:hypothetical protein
VVREEESLDSNSPTLAASPDKKSQASLSSPAKHLLGHPVPEHGSPVPAMNLLSQNGDKSNPAPTPSEDELMANLERDEKDLIKYPEIEDRGITTVTVNALEMDLEAELGPTVCNVSEGPESMTSSRSFTASPNR